MNRAKRICAYRDCDVDSHSNPHRTLFAFPKDEKRANKWREAGEVDPIDNVQQFMCDKHFSRIYMCFSARRKMLLNTAVPRRYGIEDNDEVEPEQVQSSSADAEEVTIEEHLDESLIGDADDDGEGTLTEIIYMDDYKEEQELEQDTPKRKTRKSPGTKPVNITKIEALPISGTSTVVSSSTSTGPAANGTLKNLTPPTGTVLRKVKLKKRPTVVPYNACAESISPKKMKMDQIGDGAQETVEATVSSTPEKKFSFVKLTPPKVQTSASSSKTASPKTKPVEQHKQSTSSNKKNAKSIDEKNEAIYEFIFKGEEYIQMPKALYQEELGAMKIRLGESQTEISVLQKKLDYYRNMVKDLKDFLDALQEENVE
ncbi:uncharacterized protein LOC129729858 [Wyeomyia smithii]|uniref:uncharacterized protein LOC129729858 n=1 Tax=Wyeomyia smithii TaxID=174621 RepID=UPI0024680F10|nr:uncharacterized protein LOC129729858 [Wyeomyia smithii]